MLHPNEIRITEQNQQQLMDEATKLGQRYVDALLEQIARQNAQPAV